MKPAFRIVWHEPLIDSDAEEGQSIEKNVWKGERKGGGSARHLRNQELWPRGEKTDGTPMGKKAPRSVAKPRASRSGGIESFSRGEKVEGGTGSGQRWTFQKAKRAFEVRETGKPSAERKAEHQTRRETSVSSH